MSLPELLSFSAEPIAAGVIANIPWKIDTQGREVRAPLRQQHRDTIRQRVEARMHRALTATERRELTRIVDEVDNASRRARQLDRGSRAGGESGRLPRPSEINRLPGTGQAGRGTYSYVTVVTIRDAQTGQQRTFTHVVTSTDILDGDAVRAAAMQAVASGQVMPLGDTNVKRVGGQLVEGIDIRAVYAGALRT